MVQETLGLALSSAEKFQGGLKIPANLLLYFIIRLRLIIFDLLVMQKSQITPHGNIWAWNQNVTQGSHLFLKVA